MVREDAQMCGTTHTNNTELDQYWEESASVGQGAATITLAATASSDLQTSIGCAEANASKPGQMRCLRSTSPPTPPPMI